MNVKEVAQLTGLSHQAVYKKLKANHLDLTRLKDKATGHFTPEGEAAIRALFGLQDEPKVEAPEVEKVATEVEKDAAALTAEVEKLRNRVETLEARITELTEERDYLRRLQVATLAKIPNAPLLPAGDQPGDRPGLFARLFGRKRGDKNAD